MTRRLAALLLPLLLIALTAVDAGATDRRLTPRTGEPPGPPKLPHRQKVSAFRVTPAEAHGGGKIWLSGTGFEPNRHLGLYIACPTWRDEGSILFQNYDRVPIEKGPATDDKGNFVNYPIRAIKLSHLRTSTCTVYTAFELNPYGPDIPGLYNVLAPEERLRRCDRAICAQVTVTPKRVRPGTYLHIDIGPSAKKPSWPGARAAITITYPNGLKSRVVRYLDWIGKASARVRVPTGVPQSAAGSVAVEYTFRAGHVAGSAKQRFTVTH